MLFIEKIEILQEFIFALEKNAKFCGIYFCDWKNLGTFAALIFAI